MGDKILSLTTGAEITGYLCGEKKWNLAHIYIIHKS